MSTSIVPSETPEQDAWLAREFELHPIAPGQTPEDWLLWRNMVLAGKGEQEAWTEVWGNGRSGGFGHFGNGNGNGHGHGNAIASGSGIGMNGATQQMGFEEDHQIDDDLEGMFDMNMYQFEGGHVEQPPSEVYPQYVRLQDLAPQRSSAPATGLKLESTTSNQSQLQPPGRSIPTRTPSPFEGLFPASAKTSSPSSIGLKTGPKIYPQVPTMAVNALPSPVTGHDSSTLEKAAPPPSVKRKSQSEPVAGPSSRSEPTVVGMSTIRPIISRESLSTAKKAGGLFKYLRPKDDEPAQFSPSPKELQEILVALRDYASADYLRSMADDSRYTQVFGRWLKRMNKDPDEWEVAIAPLFQVLSRTDMPINFLKEYKIAKLAKTVNDKVQSEGLVTKAQIEQAHRAYHNYVLSVLIKGNREVRIPSEEPDPVPKKRKIEEVKIEKPTNQPTKLSMLARGLVPPKAPTQPAPKSTGPPPKAAVDMSFFGSAPSSSSTTKPRPKLPDIKKVDRMIPPSAPPPAAGNLLMNTMRMLQPVKKESYETPNEGPLHAPSYPTEAKVKLNKKGFSVRFRDLVKDGGELEAVREFTRPAFEFEKPPWHVETDPHGKSSHQLDMEEGKALRTHEGLEEVIDWYDPYAYFNPTSLSTAPTAETINQENRERSILTTIDTNLDPDESTVKIIERDSNTVYLPAIPGSNAIAPVAAGMGSVSDILNKIDLSKLISVIPPGISGVGGGGIGTGYPQGYQQQLPYGSIPGVAGGGEPYQYATTSAYSQQPQQQYPTWTPNPNPNPQPVPYGEPPRAAWGGVDNYATARDVEMRDRDSGRRGKGKKRQCKFWAQGDCRQGGSCPFLHE